VASHAPLLDLVVPGEEHCYRLASRRPVSQLGGGLMDRVIITAEAPERLAKGRLNRVSLGWRDLGMIGDPPGRHDDRAVVG
jgi:hypothetical protein